MKWWFTLAMLTSVLFGCKLFRSDHIGPKNLDDAYSLWQTKAPASYSIREDFTCNCKPPSSYRITVSGNQVTGVYDFTTDQPINPDSISEKLYKTVDGMFAWLRALQQLNPYRLQIYYDLNYGYPTQVYFDPDKQHVDDEIVLTVSSFEPQ